MIYTTNIQDIEKYNTKTFRSLLRHFALSGLSLKNKLGNGQKTLKKPRVQFLYIHHVFDDELKKFDELLKFLSSTHTFITYNEAVDKRLEIQNYFPSHAVV